MNEKEKCKMGLLYDANYDPELVNDRIKCQDKCFLYNQIKPSDIESRDIAIKNIINDIGKNFRIEQPFHCDLGYNIHIGDNFYSNYNLVILDGADVNIGNNVFIAPDCGIYTAGHPINVKQRNSGLEYAKSVNIGNNVWIGGGVKIMPGVTIGDNVVIGGGSVVVKDIPSNVIAVGNPCKVIKQINEEDLV